VAQQTHLARRGNLSLDPLDPDTQRPRHLKTSDQMMRSTTDRESNRDQMVRVRFTLAEKSSLQRQANEAGLTLSDYVRNRTVGGKPQTVKATPERRNLIKLTGELNKAGSNVNQIARALNRRDELGERLGVDRKVIELALADLKLITTKIIKELGYDGDTR